MKRTIEVWTDYDKSGRWCVKVQKKRGRLSVDEIKEAARSVDWDYYLLVLDCYHDDESQYIEEPVGDFALLYRTDLLYEESEK